MSRKVRAERRWFEAVYAMVDARSEGWCEIREPHDGMRGWPVRHAAEDHHHLFKPRRSFHQPRNILHICRAAHEEFDKPYALGRRVVTGWDAARGIYRTEVITAVNKWVAREKGLVG